MKKSLIALSFGTLGLGIAEFVMMGILPDVAQALNISITKAGHFISAYALGVCVGAPTLILARKFPLKKILLTLVGFIMLGNLCAALSPNYHFMLLGRFLSGLPHGAYFGVASIIAEKLAAKGRGSEAVAIMVAGMTVANLFGVPLGTALSTTISWRATFLLVTGWGIVIFYSIWRWVPQVESLPDTGLKGQFHFLKSPAPWLILLATALGNGGIFCWYSYITPLLTHIAHFKPDSITGLMVLAGLGMVIGNLVGGRLADPFYSGKSCCNHTRDGMYYPSSDILFFASLLAYHCPDVFMYGWSICHIQSATSIYHPLFQRGRNAGCRKRTNCI